jgi:branched-subunit amino acid transport protein
MKIWAIIFTAITVTVLLRILPVFLHKLPIKKSKRFFEFLDYAACAAIGSMIYISAIPHLSDNGVKNRSSFLLSCNILILLLSFFLSLKIKNPVKTFIICIVLYAAINAIIFL